MSDPPRINGVSQRNVLLAHPTPQLEYLMQFMLTFTQPTEEFAKAADPAQAGSYFGAWKAYIGAMAQAGVIVSGHGLMPPQTATMVRLRDGKRQVQDGPYADTKEHLGGYFVIEVASQEEALEWAARSPASSVGHTEVRPVMPPQP